MAEAGVGNSIFGPMQSQRGRVAGRTAEKLAEWGSYSAHP